MPRSHVAAIALAALLVAGGGAWWLLVRGSAAPGDGVNAPASGVRVKRRELAPREHSKLSAFLDWWEEFGPHTITLAYADPRWPWVAPAGERTQADVDGAHASGQSNATTIKQTAHGPRLENGVAVAWARDLWPDEFDPRTPWAQQPASVRAKFAELGRLAEAHGLTWGGRWGSLGGGAGDQPHVEVPGWQLAPVPKAVA